MRWRCFSGPRPALDRAAGPLFDHLIRPLQERRRDREGEGPGGLEVDHQPELRGLLDREVGWFRTFEDPVDEGC